MNEPDRLSPSPSLTRAQVREIDRIAIEEYGIPGIVLMENAARSAADHIATLLRRPAASVAIVCGNGNNGGDGFAIARHLSIRGFRVTTYSGLPGKISDDCRTNRDIARRMGIPDEPFDAADQLGQRHNLIIDALVGTGLRAHPSEQIAGLIARINSSGKPVIAIDIPSGLDCDTGQPLGEAVKAITTITFVARKIGFTADNDAGSHPGTYTGEVVVVGIGAPPEIIERVRRMASSGPNA